MPIFFFDFTDGPYTTRDREGHRCDNTEAARIEALRVLPEVLLSNPQDGDEREVTCSVRDERGSVLYRVSATLKAQSLAKR